MRPFWLIGLLCCLMSAAVPGAAQETGQPLVVFIDDSDMRTASVLDVGPDGLTQLEAIFVSLGAQTMRANLNEPLPEAADVIVFVRPYRRVSVAQAARLWLQVERGANVLYAVDPSDHIQGQTDGQNAPLSSIFFADYGLRPLEGILIEPGLSQTALRVLSRSISRVQPYAAAPHPLIAPLLDYDLPVYVWGARSIQVDALGVYSRADTLLFTVPEFAETDTGIYANFNAAEIRLDLNRDRLGVMLTGAVGENARTGTRLVMLADSEMVQNGYGLAQFVDGGLVRPANVVLAQRIAAWLLELPEEDWLGLPLGFTWLSLDGGAADWDSTLPIIPDSTQAEIDPALDLQYAQAFSNDDFLYLLVETEQPAPADARLDLGFDINRDGTTDVTIGVTTERAFFAGFSDSEFPIPDGQMVAGEVLELRIPRRVILADLPLSNICLSTADTAEPADCLDQIVTPVSVAARDPESLRYTPNLLATVEVSGGVSIRTGPDFGYSEVTLLPNQALIGAIGRTEDAEWIQVQNARYVGWISAGALRPNGDFEALPVVDVPEQ